MGRAVCKAFSYARGAVSFVSSEITSDRRRLTQRRTRPFVESETTHFQQARYRYN